MSRVRRREMVDRQHPKLSTVRQCALLGISRSSMYYRLRTTSLEACVPLSNHFSDSIANFLEGASQAKPLVLILDNLHWADRPSLLLLEFLAQELQRGRLLVVGTYRDEEIFDDHPLTQTLGELTKEPHFQRVPLTAQCRGVAP